MLRVDGFSARRSQPSPFRGAIWPVASRAQINLAGVSTQGKTVGVLILRLNSSCNRDPAEPRSPVICGAIALGLPEGDRVPFQAPFAKQRLALGRPLRLAFRMDHGFVGGRYFFPRAPRSRGQQVALLLRRAALTGASGPRPRLRNARRAVDPFGEFGRASAWSRRQ